MNKLKKNGKNRSEKLIKTENRKTVNKTLHRQNIIVAAVVERLKKNGRKKP